MALVESPRAKLPDLGQRGDSIVPVVEAFQALGIRVSRDAITQLRGGTTSGAEIARAVAAAEIIARGDVSSKNMFYKEYGVLGITKREKRTGDRSKGFVFRGLKRTMLNELGVTGENLGNLVKALRIDLFYTPADQLGISFPANYRETVEAYLKDLGKRKNKQKAEEIARKWGKSKTVRNFNGIILNQPREIVAAWTPYEMEPIRTLATNRLNHHSPPTPFDRMVLMGVDGNRLDQAVMERIKEDIGVNISRQIIDSYRALLMGRIKINAQKLD